MKIKKLQKFIKSCPKSGFYLIMPFIKMDQKITKYLGYFWEKMCYPDLSKQPNLTVKQLFQDVKHCFSLKSQPVNSLRVKHSAKSRFNVPSSAVSLPSIALLSSNDDGDSRSRRKSDHSPEKRRALKPVKSASGLLRPNLERIPGSDSSSSSDSSAENLHQGLIP